MWLSIWNKCRLLCVCRSCRCLYLDVSDLWNKNTKENKLKKTYQYDTKILYVVFVFCKWTKKRSWVICLLYSGYSEYFSDADKMLYLFYVRVVEYAGFCTCVLFIYPVIWRKCYGNKTLKKESHVLCFHLGFQWVPAGDWVNILLAESNR